MLKNPRPYDVVLFWTVKSNCDHCDAMLEEFKQVVYSFIQERGIDKMHKEKKIFFGVVYFTKAKEVQKLFKDNDMLTVPYLSVSPLDLKRDEHSPLFKTENKWLIGQGEVNDATKQIEFINNSLRTDVKIKYPFSTILIKNMMGLAIIAVFFQLVKHLYSILLKQWVWFAIAITVFLVCTGGIVYSILNNMPLFRFERNEFGSVVVGEYVMRGQRGQWMGEGYMASGLFTVIGLMYLGLANINTFVESKLHQRIWVLVMLVAIYIMQSLLLQMYKIKSPWYNPGFMPPNYYLTGSLARDQGNNI